MVLGSLVLLLGLWYAVSADVKHCPVQRSLLVSDLSWYEAKTYCESRGLSLSEVEPGAGAGGLLANYIGIRSSGRQWHAGPVFMGPGCTIGANYTCRPLNCTMLIGNTLVNVSCSQKAQAACQLINTTENQLEPYQFRLVRVPHSWGGAHQYCSLLNMTLVVIPDEQKHHQLVEYLLLEETKWGTSLFGDFYIGFTQQRGDKRSNLWVEGSEVTWSNFVDDPSPGEFGVLRISEMFKWDWSEGNQRRNFICEKFPSPSIRFGLASFGPDGPEVDQNNCDETSYPGLSYIVYNHRPGQRMFLIDDKAAQRMYDSRKLGFKYEFRIWMRKSTTNANVRTFRVRITTIGHQVSCNSPQTLVYTAAKPAYEGRCGKQIQCKHVGDVEERNMGPMGFLKSCVYECQCVDVRCQCSHLVIRFYYVPWIANSQQDGYLYHLAGI